ncbi:hypothetical protein A2U01_0101565, partial [Trifolium medium]|nr:hypothetical protein [Trifolium medium]
MLPLLLMKMLKHKAAKRTPPASNDGDCS